MKKILICNISYFPEVGGVENSLRHLKDEYKKLGYDVSLLVGTKENSLGEVKEAGVIKFKRNRFNQRVLSRLNFIFMILDLFCELFKLRGRGMELCISRNQFLTIVAKIFLECPVVYVVPGFAYFQQSKSNLHGSVFSQAKRIAHHLCDKIALQFADRVFVFSNNMMTQALRVNSNVKNKITLTQPGVDISRFLPRDSNEHTRDCFLEAHGLGSHSILILCLGRLVKAKGFDMVIDALRYMPHQYKCIVAGDGPERYSLEEKAKFHSVDDRVLFIGKVSSPEKIYPFCDVFAMTSKYEPFGQTILEAMSCDLPVVAFDDSGITTATYEICGKNASYCSHDAKSLADIIMAAHQEYKSGSNRLFVSAKYSWNQLAIHLVSVK